MINLNWFFSWKLLKKKVIENFAPEKAEMTSLRIMSEYLYFYRRQIRRYRQIQHACEAVAVKAVVSQSSDIETALDESKCPRHVINDSHNLPSHSQLNPDSILLSNVQAHEVNMLKPAIVGLEIQPTTDKTPLTRWPNKAWPSPTRRRDINS